MPTFQRKRYGAPRTPTEKFFARCSGYVRRYPFALFGAPFMATIVASSYGLSYFTQTKYDYNATKVQAISKEKEIGLRANRRKVDLREEYYRLQQKGDESDDYEPVRVPRPEGYKEPPAPRRKQIDLDSIEEADQRMTSALPPRKASARPSVILGPDGKPCKACNSKLAFSAAMKSSSSRGTVTPAAAATSTADCPPDGEQLGQNTWTFLHSAAAYYPDQPSQTQQSAMLSMIRALPHVYPCHHCAQHLGEQLSLEEQRRESWNKGQPLQTAVETGPTFRKWLCGIHNEVNQRLGKPCWTCDEATLRQRWLDGPADGRCD